MSKSKSRMLSKISIFVLTVLPSYAMMPGNAAAQERVAQNAASSVCICNFNNGTYSAWFRSRPSNWGTPNSLAIYADSCVDTGLCGSMSGVQSYVRGSFTITPSSFQQIGNLFGVIGTLSN